MFCPSDGDILDFNISTTSMFFSLENEQTKNYIYPIQHIDILKKILERLYTI